MNSDSLIWICQFAMVEASEAANYCGRWQSPPPPVRNRLHHWGLRPLLFSKISVVLLRFLLIDTEGWRRQGTAHDAIIELRKFRTYSQTSHHDIASIFKDSSWYYGPAGISTRFFLPANQCSIDWANGRRLAGGFNPIRNGEIFSMNDNTICYFYSSR